MWQRGGPPATSSALQQPAQAASAPTRRAHDAPASMGDVSRGFAGEGRGIPELIAFHLQDAYLRRPASQNSRGSSTAPLAAGAAATGRRSSFATDSSNSHGGAAAGGAGAIPEDDGLDDSYKAGMPIGLLAAIGEFSPGFGRAEGSALTRPATDSI